MKNFIFTTLLFSSFFASKCFGQVVIADPAVNVMRTADITSLPVNSGAIPIDSVISLKIPVINYNLNNSLPSGTCKIKIGLGSKLVLDPNFDLSTVVTSNYFNWTAVLSGGQIQITGDLIAILPANFLDTATFNIKGTILGNSTITTNFLITNHNSPVILSDENGANNNAALSYTIVERQGGPVPVSFTKIVATKEACNIKVNFDTENEINVSRYEVEVSKDGIRFENIGQLAANNRIKYSYSFAITDNLRAPQLYIRIKSLDIDGKFQYSETKTIAGSCDQKNNGVILFPNPLTQNITSVVVQAKESLFKGNYSITLLDITGKILKTTNLDLLNVKQFNVETGNLATGQYIIKLIKKDGTENVNLTFQKL